jgi:hypothetical protein
MIEPLRNCETCQHFEHRSHMARPFCHKGQKLSFVFPKKPQAPAGTWGWQTRCRLYVKSSAVSSSPSEQTGSPSPSPA